MLKFHNILHVNDPNHPNEISLVFDSQPFCIKCKILQDLTQSISLTCCMVDTRIDIYLTLSFFILKKFIKMLFALQLLRISIHIYLFMDFYLWANQIKVVLGCESVISFVCMCLRAHWHECCHLFRPLWSHSPVISCIIHF